MSDHPGGGEAGFTLIEMVVSLAVIGIGLFGLIGVLLGSLRTSSAADARTSAAAVAEAELEALRAVPYAVLGMPVTGAEVDFEGDPTVTVADLDAQTGPLGQETFKGETFSVRRHVVWTAPAEPRYKRLVVEVDWTDSGGVHTVRQVSSVYPGGAAIAATPSTAPPPGGLLAPSGCTVTPGADSPSTQLDLSWTPNGPEPTWWEITYRDNEDSIVNLYVATTTQPGGSPTYSAVGLAPGHPHDFFVRGRRSDTDRSAVLACPTTSTAPAPAAPVCQGLAGSATPSPVSRQSRNNPRLRSNVNVSLNTSGPCGPLTATFSPAGPGTAVVTRAMSVNDGIYTLQIGASTYDWAAANHVFFVRDAAGVEVAQIALLVNA